MRRIILVVILCSIQIFAQSSNLKFIHITTDNGLSQSNIRAIIQDRYGFIWFGTFDGLNKFDGYNFKIYKTIRNDSTSLCNNALLSLF